MKAVPHFSRSAIQPGIRLYQGALPCAPAMLVLIVLVLFISAPVYAQENDVPRFEAGACPFENYSSYPIDCGYVIAPEDHNQPETGKTIRLAVAIVRSLNGNKAPDPVMYLAGGPGGAFVASAPLMTFELESALADRDVILYDQRGMGLSQPLLSCPLQNPLVVISADSSQPTFIEVMRDTGGLGACEQRLKADGIDVTLYNTIQNAHDIGAIREVLGYEQVNLYGASWGTRLGLVALREHVPGIRSAILDSVLPPDVNVLASAPYTFDRAFTELEKGCQADTVCRLAYPNLREMYVQTYDRLSRDPAQIQVDGLMLTLTADGFASQVYNGLTFRDSLQNVPGFIANVAGENYEDVIKQLAMITQGIEQGKTLDQGAYMTMACPEQLSNTTLAQIQAEEAKYPPAFRRPSPFFGSGGYYVCQAWSDIQTISAAPAVSDVPVLLLAGQYDPLTPPEWAHHAAETLPNSFVYELPGTGHVVVKDVCARKMMRGFLADPSTAPDSTCVASMPAPVFVLSIAATRPVVQIGAMLLTGLMLYLLATAARAFGRHPGQTAWRTSLKMMGWIPAALSAVMILLLIHDEESTLMPGSNLTPLQAIIPLAMAIQAALVFAADDEPGLEMLLALPRSITWMIVERLAVVIVSQTGIALIGAALILAKQPEQDIALLLISWIPSSVFLSGLALYVTLRSRVALFGALLAGILWFIFAMFGGFFLPGTAWMPPLNLIQPFLWAVHVHAAPEDFALMRDFWLNRLFLTGAGVWFIWQGLREVKDEEYLLMSASDKQRRRSVKTGEAAPVIGSKHKIEMVVRAVDTFISPLHQIAGMAWYEYKMHWQRRAIKVISLTIVLGMGAMLLIVGDSVTTMIPGLGDLSLLPVDQQQIAKGTVLAMLTASIVLTMLMLVLPVVMADTVPLDSAQHMDELLNSLPATPAVYLAGKLCGLWLAGVVGAVGAMVFVGVLWYLRAGAYNVLPYLDIWLTAGMPLIILKGGLALLIGATQPTRRRAGLAVIIVFIVTFPLGSPLDGSGLNVLLNPVPYAVLMENLTSTFQVLGTLPVTLPPSNLAIPAVIQAHAAGILQLVVVWVAVWAWMKKKQ